MTLSPKLKLFSEHEILGIRIRTHPHPKKKTKQKNQQQQQPVSRQRFLKDK